MTLLEIINIINFIVGDRSPDIGFTPKRFGQMLHIASLKHYKRKLGLPEEYQPGMPLPRQAFDITQKITEDMRGFKIELSGNNMLKFYNGKAAYPDRYYYPSSMSAVREDGGMKKVTFVTDQRMDEMMGNYVDIPSYEYPVATFQNDYIQIAPESITKAKFVYLRLPEKPVYSVKVINGVSVYDSQNSTQFEWDEVNQIDIMAILLSDLGISLRREDVMQVAEKHKIQGI